MIGIVIIGHGKLAEELHKALVHVMGEQQYVEHINIEAQDDMEQKRQDLEKAIESVNQGQGVVVLSDMFGGTPSNLAISLTNQDNVDVIAGVNLPMLIKLATVRESLPLHKAVIEAQEAARSYINVASKLLAANG